MEAQTTFAPGEGCRIGAGDVVARVHHPVFDDLALILPVGGALRLLHGAARLVVLDVGRFAAPQDQVRELEQPFPVLGLDA